MNITFSDKTILVTGATRGIGAKIAEDKFQDLFTSSTKKIMSGDKYLSVNVVKGGLKNPEHEVDAIAGATITSNGVGAMLRSGFKPYMKAFRVKAGMNLRAEIQKYPSADLVLLDTYEEKVLGGTGKSFDWVLAESVARDNDIRLVLAGGLNSNNVNAAVEKLSPFGLDVSSGVESSLRLKY